MPDVDGSLEVQLCNERRKIVGVRVHVVAAPRLAGAPVPTAVVADAPVSVRCQIKHRIFPGIDCQWPPIAEDDRLTRSPILVVDLGPVFGGEGAHPEFSITV